MRTALSLLALLAAGAALGQSTAQGDPISTARPSFSDTPGIVPVRTLQLESGLSFYSRGGSGDERWDFGEALLRYGLRPRLEVRLQLPNYNLQYGGAPDGFDNTSVAISYYLGKLLGFDVGVIPTLGFPTGARGLRYDGATPSFSVNAQRGIGGGDTVGGTFDQSYARQDGRSVTLTLATLNAVHPFTEKLTGFVEYGGFYSDRDRPHPLRPPRGAVPRHEDVAVRRPRRLRPRRSRRARVRRRGLLRPVLKSLYPRAWPGFDLSG